MHIFECFIFSVAASLIDFGARVLGVPGTSVQSETVVAVKVGGAVCEYIFDSYGAYTHIITPFNVRPDTPALFRSRASHLVYNMRFKSIAH